MTNSSTRFILFVAGRTHDSTYTLYRLGERLSTGVRLYVETGRTDGLDADGDSPSSLHSFTGPPVPQGEGSSIARAFLDGNHTLISIMARINPSPDWYVGVDSFQLCVEGNWVDTVTVEVITTDKILIRLSCRGCTLLCSLPLFSETVSQQVFTAAMHSSR